MALKLFFVLALWHLSLSVRGVLSSCNITCSTDYSTSLNCSCAAVQTRSVLLHVQCRDEEVIEDFCEVKPSQSWCVMFPGNFEVVLSASTLCVARATDEDRELIPSSEPWALSDVVKVEPPSKVQVTNTKDSYSITWDHVNQLDCLTYVVRVREANQWSKEPLYSLSSDSKLLKLKSEKLLPRVGYLVDVKAKMCPDKVLEGPWSDWSSTAEIRATATPPSLETTLNWHLFYITPSVLTFVVVASLVLSYVIKNHQIPKPEHFFAPLYHNYGGNFKEWVNPVFKECDYLMISSPVQMKNEQEVLQWNSEKESCPESKEMKKRDPFFLKLQAHDHPLLLCQDGGSWSRHGAGPISIHTVTLSEEEEFEEEGVSRSSACVLGSDRDRESFEVFVEPLKERAAYGLEEAESGLAPVLQRQASGGSSGEDDDVSLGHQFFEAEGASLDSLALNEQSEDGYPHVDLDTIDSGFGEYNSPGASPGAEQTQSLHQHINLHSNYVKQWVVGKSAEEG